MGELEAAEEAIPRLVNVVGVVCKERVVYAFRKDPNADGAP